MFTRYIYPLWIREKISARVSRYSRNLSYKNVSVIFSKKIMLDLCSTDVGHQSIKFNGFYELNLSREIVAFGREGGVLVDVGANYGYFSCLWASCKQGNRVVAFEASPLNLSSLVNNVSKNNLCDSVVVVPEAVGKENGSISFSLENNSGQTGWGGISLDCSMNTVNVTVTTLDNYALSHKLDKIDVLKIDTEGADTWVLYGAKDLLMSKKIRHIYFEHNPVRMNILGIGENEAIKFLIEMGYRVEKRSESDYYACPLI